MKKWNISGPEYMGDEFIRGVPPVVKVVYRPDPNRKFRMRLRISKHMSLFRQVRTACQVLRDQVQEGVLR